MKTLDIGCGDVESNWIPNSDGIDMFDYGQHYQFNIEKDFPWPIEDNTYDKVVALHILEHISDGWVFIKIMNEIYRVSKNGAIFTGAAPHFPSSPNFYRDPTHCRMINEYTFDMFLKDSPIHFGTGYDIKCCFLNNGISVNSNRDICWNLAVYKKG